MVPAPPPNLLAEGVAERIVEFVAGGRGGSTERLAELDVEPPLLSVICRELNDRRRVLGRAQISTNLVSGNRREILTDFYERSVADLPDGMRMFVEDHLLTKSGFRDNLALESALEFPGVTRSLIDTLVARRLLRIEDRLGVQRVELTHDVLADVSGADDHEFRVWDLRTGRPASPMMRTDDRIYFSGFGHFSPDNRRIAVGTVSGGAQVWDIASGKLVFDLLPSTGNDPMLFVRFSPDGKRIATANYAEARLWDAATGKSVSPVLEVNGTIPSVAFSPDGRYFATASDSRVAQVWDARDGTAIGEPMVHNGPINALEFDESGSRLVTSSSDRTARVWDVQTGLPLTEPYVHPSPVGLGPAGSHMVRFSPGPGRFILTTTNEATYIWPVPPAGEGPVPAWLMQLASASGGKVMTDAGAPEDFRGAGEKIDDLRRTLAALPDDAPYISWGRWFFADRATRGIAPGFTLTHEEAARFLIGTTSAVGGEPSTP